MVRFGRVFEIVCCRQLLFVNPPLQAPGTSHRQMYVMIYGWVRAGFRDCLLQAIIVCEPAPTTARYILIYGSVRAGFRHCLLQAIIVCEPAPTSTRYILIYAWVGAGFRDCQLLEIILCKTRP